MISFIVSTSDFFLEIQLMKCPNKEIQGLEETIQSAKYLESKLEDLTWISRTHVMSHTVLHVCNLCAGVV